MKIQRRTRRGFTLIELLVVLVILALLAGIVLPRFLERGEAAKVAAAKSQISSFKTALTMYAVDNGEPPSTEQGLQSLIVEPTSSPRPMKWKRYLTDVNEVPKDPWGNDYVYQSPGPNGEDFFVASMGKDGREGGTEYDADLDSTQTQQ